MIVTHLRHGNKITIIKPGMHWYTQNNAQFEKPRLNNAREKANNKAFFFFVKSNTRILSHVNMCQNEKKEKKRRSYIHDLLSVLNNCTKSQLNRIYSQNWNNVTRDLETKSMSSNLQWKRSPEQGYGHARFQRYRLESVRKTGFFFFFERGNISIISPEHVRNSQIVE